MVNACQYLIKYKGEGLPKKGVTWESGLLIVPASLLIMPRTWKLFLAHGGSLFISAHDFFTMQ